MKTNNKPAKGQSFRGLAFGNMKTASRKKYDPPRRLGRVSDGDWGTIKAAAKASGKNFTQWAVGLLLAAARRKK